MSEKKFYKLIFKQQQPIHIGTGRYGVISETRIFVPGWTMWGALTKKYNQLFENGDLSKNQELFEEITCFYPAFESKQFKPLLPKWENGEFYLDSCSETAFSETAFRAKFVDTFVSTSIVPLSRMAKDESLHEINIILPSIKKEFSEGINKELFWVGILKVNAEVRKTFLKENNLELIVGGDSRYGFGKFLLTKIDETSELDEDFNNIYFSNFLSISLPEKEVIVESKIENIIEMDRNQGNKSFSIKSKGLYYLPGYNKDILKNSISQTELVKGCLEKK
ncbi:MAG TPA: hypothetical protein PK723_04660 [Candidatus Pacearchaeota archaeon]|nr:hypothetical protein [Candidatus Pacearchaeota archaeon]